MKELTKLTGRKLSRAVGLTPLGFIADRGQNPAAKIYLREHSDVCTTATSYPVYFTITNE